MSTRGFTLIETLVYLALFAIMFGGFVVSVYALFGSGDHNQSKAMLQEEKNFLVGKINWMLSGASSVGTPAAGGSGATLVATKYGTQNTVDRSSGHMRFNSAQLSNDNVTISKLVFIHTYAGGTNPDSVEAGFTIRATTSEGSTVSQSASTTVYIRK